MYAALRAHFLTKGYDYFRYNGKTKVTVETFEKRRDIQQFKKLAKHPDAFNYILANFIEKDTFVSELAYNADSTKTYLAWKKRAQSISYIFKQEIETLLPDLSSNFKTTKGEHPHIIKLYLKKKICIETLSILLDMFDLIVYYDRSLSDDPLWSWLGLRLKRYHPFIKYDKNKFKALLLEKFKPK